jgi:transposase
MSGGRPPKVDRATRERIACIARCCPRDLGRPFSTWSLSELRDMLATSKIADISRETLRTILRTQGVSWQATKTWKAGTDPDFTTKMNRILDLYDHPPADGRVICVDEFGPLNLQPRPGRGWFPTRRPRRLRATYHRDHGVRHLLGALDLATGRIHYRIRDRKRRIEFLAFLETLRARRPGEKLYVIVDNFSPHKRVEVQEWAAFNNVELVFLPTYSSWLNWIEAEFAATGRRVLCTAPTTASPRSLRHSRCTHRPHVPRSASCRAAGTDVFSRHAEDAQNAGSAAALPTPMSYRPLTPRRGLRTVRDAHPRPAGSSPARGSRTSGLVPLTCQDGRAIGVEERRRSPPRPPRRRVEPRCGHPTTAASRI